MKTTELSTLSINHTLIRELQHFASTLKAELVYRKCIQRGRLKTAEQIRVKYNLQALHDDSVEAFSLALRLTSKPKAI